MRCGAGLLGMLLTVVLAATSEISVSAIDEPPRLEDNGLEMTCGPFPKRIALLDQSVGVRVVLTVTGKLGFSSTSYCSDLVRNLEDKNYRARLDAENQLSRKFFLTGSKMWLDWAEKALEGVKHTEARMRLGALVDAIKLLPEVTADSQLVQFRRTHPYFIIERVRGHDSWEQFCTSEFARQGVHRDDLGIDDLGLKRGQSQEYEVCMRSSLKPGRYRAKCLFTGHDSGESEGSWNLSGDWEEFDIVHECPARFALVQKALPPGWLVTRGAGGQEPPVYWEKGNLYVPGLFEKVEDWPKGRVAETVLAVYVDSWFDAPTDPDWWPGFREYLSLTWTPADYDGQRLAKEKKEDCAELIGANASGMWFGRGTSAMERATLKYAKEHFGKDAETGKEK